jgi:hypothetical protein
MSFFNQSFKFLSVILGITESLEESIVESIKFIHMNFCPIVLIVICSVHNVFTPEMIQLISVYQYAL